MTSLTISSTQTPPSAPKKQTNEEIYDDGFLRVEQVYYYISCGIQIVKFNRVDFLIISALTKRQVTSFRRSKSGEKFGARARR